MKTVTVSPKFQVVIPREIRQSLKIRAGEKVHVMQYRGRVEFIPIRPMKKLRGLLQGMDTRLEREPDRI
jgi:AbrB family looped-hinge helix DNA binding protein